MPKGLNVHSEIGRLRKVMLHRPGDELLNLSPDSLERLLFDDIPFLAEAQREHDTFARMLADEGVEVLYLDQLAAEAIDACPGGREQFVDRYVAECGLDGCDALQQIVRDVLLAEKTTKDLVDKAITGIRADEVPAQTSRRSLADILNANGAEEDGLLVDPIPNVYFTRDSFSVVGAGVSINHMHTVTRRRETLLGDFIFSHHPEYVGAPRWYSRETPLHIEGGDILVLGNRTVAVGISERTQSAAVDVFARELLWGGEASGIDRVLAFLIPRKRAFMHRDTVFTPLDVDTFTMHPGILGTLEVFELTRGASKGEVSIRRHDDSLDRILAAALGLDGVRLIKCGGDDAIAATREQWNDGSNTLAVAPGRVFVYQRNQVTNEILYKAGIELLVMPSGELSRGRGGPHCMSMAFWRDDL